MHFNTLLQHFFYAQTLKPPSELVEQAVVFECNCRKTAIYEEFVLCTSILCTSTRPNVDKLYITNEIQTHASSA